ncbi:MAG: sigma-70 family RNA polymerase sigma factor [Candidatus Peregrinibacteria bacterium]|nr:sigma-70 family RNA polymerase sigma factor [Candidatus Peregrinibacteria bacterium]
MALKYNKDKIEKLVLRSQQGDSEAFGQIYDVFVDAIYRYVYYRVKNEEVEDLVEIVFLKSWENINKYKKGKYSFSAWIFRIAHNLVIDYYRGKEARVDTLQLDEVLEETIQSYQREHKPIGCTELNLNNEILIRALGTLKKTHYDFIVLKFINQLSNEEIAEILGKNESALRVMQFRALKELRTVLQAFEFDI